MKTYAAVIFILVACSVIFSAEIVDNQVIIQFNKELSTQYQQQIIKNNHLLPLRLLSDRLNIWLCEINDQRSEQQALSDLKKLDSIKFAQMNHVLELRETIPDDQYFSLQWCLQNTGQSGGVIDADIDATDAWDYLTGGINANDHDVVVAIVDSGTDLDHPDLNFYKNENEIPDNGIDDDNNGYIDDYDGWNAYNHNGNPSTSSHGTHVCGIAAAMGNNGTGVAGVNWDAKIMPVSGSSNSEATVVEAYAYILDMRTAYNETNGDTGALVVATNSSFGVNYGQPEDFPIWCAMYDSLGMQGVLSMGATANASWNIDETGDIPTACPSEWMIAVTNTNNMDEKYGSAGYGLETIDLGAPGTNIYSTDIYGSGYSYKTGTSMAAPQVCGAAAFLYSALPAVTLREYEPIPGELALIIRDAIFSGVDTLDDLQGITVTGGRLNIYNSLLILRSGEYGDVNNDGTIDSYDASLLLQYFVGIEPDNLPLPWAIWRKGNADVDGNSYIEAYDSSLIMRFAVGLINSFPVED